MQNIIKISGISRGKIYSPNHTNNDWLIFQQTVNELQAMGVSVTVMDEDDFLISDKQENIIFSMARNPESVVKLSRLEKEGALVINSGDAIYNCYRANLTRIMLNNKVSYPQSIVVNTDNLLWEELAVFEKYPLWIKRGDVHAIHKEDVVLVYCLAEVNNVLSEFNKRGIREAVIMEHIYGDIIKFYAIKGGAYFHWFPLLDSSHSKFNMEKEVNSNNHTPFAIDDLYRLVESAAQSVGVLVYGGDVIVRKDGSLCLIDLNDWPSFAPVRGIASKHIAQLIYHQAINHIKESTQTFVIQNQFI